MKSPALHSLKFSKLKRRLKLSHWQCVGILESLWLFTQANAPRGDVGKHSDEDIAAAIEWDGDASELVRNLTECGWLDSCDENRLVVHDWADHAPKYLKGALHKNGQDFAKPANSTLLKHSAKQPAKQPAKQGARAPDTKPNLTKPNQAEESREPATPDSPPAAVVLTYTTVGSGPREWHLTEPHLAELRSLYPGVDVLAECRKALAWLNANTSKRKTHRGMPAFLVRWLNKATDGGPGSRAPAGRPSPSSSLPYDDYSNYAPKDQTQ